MSTDIKYSRKWCMPNSNTFAMKPVSDFVFRYLEQSKESIDPCARNFMYATHTNDIDPSTKADCHMDAREFLDSLKLKGVVADLVILDPPYTPRQIAECYKSIGKTVTQLDTQTGVFMKSLKDKTADLVKTHGIVLSFGYNTVGMGTKRGFEIIEIMLVCHGGVHFDTICMAERKL